MILGMKVRKHDLDSMLKFEPKILEFHFSDSDLDLQLEGDFSQNLIVHCFEYYDKKLLDIVALKETNQIHSREKSLELVQKAIDKTITLNEHFSGKPSMIVHPGGYTMYSDELEQENIQTMKELTVDAIKELDTKNVNFLLENMPPYAWFYGGRWTSNVFLSADDMVNYCKKTGLHVCYDLCHSQLYCNKSKISVIDEFKKIENYVDHFHLSDADNDGDEGLQFGEGNFPFDKIIPLLNRHNQKGFAIEVWKGHERSGKGFKEFLEKIKHHGLIVN